MAVTDYLNPLTDPSVQRIAAGDLTATFLSLYGMRAAFRVNVEEFFP